MVFVVKLSENTSRVRNFLDSIFILMLEYDREKKGCRNYSKCDV